MEGKKIYTLKSKTKHSKTLLNPSSTTTTTTTTTSSSSTTTTATITGNTIDGKTKTGSGGGGGTSDKDSTNNNVKYDSSPFVNIDIYTDVNSFAKSSQSLPDITLYDVFIDNHEPLPKSSSSISLDKHIISLTRPRTLPPKSPKEEKKHLKQHKEMMRKAKAKDEEHQRRTEKKRKEREELMTKLIKVWQTEIIPKWPKSRLELESNDLWWHGIPPIIRGKVWQMVIRNDLRLTTEIYEHLIKRSQFLQTDYKILVSSNEVTGEMFKEKEFLQKTQEMIMLDASRTFPALGLFQSTGPYQQKLINVLTAFALYRPDLGYVQGMSFHAAMFLVNMDEGETFISMANLFNKPFLTLFYQLNQSKINRYFRVFSMFFAEYLPDLYLYFIKLNIDLHMFLLEWYCLNVDLLLYLRFLSLFSRSLPMDVAMRIWDCFLITGEVFLMRTGVGLLKYFENNLQNASFESCLSLLTHLPTEIDQDRLFDCIKQVEISSDKYFNLLCTI